MMIPGRVRLVMVIAALCALISSGCSGGESKTVQQVISSDGQYWAFVHQAPSSFIVGSHNQNKPDQPAVPGADAIVP